jgi:hypothetical protein
VWQAKQVEAKRRIMVARAMERHDGASMASRHMARESGAN